MEKSTFIRVLIISILFTFQYAYCSISILSHTPSTNALNVSPSADITVQFSASMNTATLTNSTIRVYGEQSGLRHSVITFNSSTNTVTINPDSAFFIGETVWIVVTKEVKSISNDSLTSPLIWQFGIDVTYATTSYVLDTIITSVSTCAAVAFCDLDNDGDIDAAFSSHDGGAVTIFKNNGTGRFSTFSVLSGGGLGWGTYDPASGDFNADGYLDLAIPSRFSNVISVWFNNGNGTFTHIQQVAVNSEPQQAIPGDFNGDGYLDIAACCNNSGTFYYDILINDRTGHFTRTQQVPIPQRPDNGSIGDFDNDGDVDIIVCDIPQAGTSSDFLLVNNGNAVFSFLTLPVINTGYYPYFGDVDGDGDLDLITGGFANDPVNGMKVLINNDTGIYTEGQSFGNDSDFYMDKGLIDINNDGHLDVVVINYTLQYQREIYTNDGSGNFTFSFTVPNWTGSSPHGFGMDIDKDGDLDMGGGKNGNFTVYRGAHCSPPAAFALNTPLNNDTSVALTPTLTWNTSPGTTLYRLQVSTSPAFTSYLINLLTTLPYHTLSPGYLQFNTQYYWRVYAKNTCDSIRSQSEFSFRTVPPSVPTLISPGNDSAITNLTPLMDWDDVSGATAYNLQVSLDSNFGTFKVNINVAASNYTIPSGIITANGSYYWKVRVIGPVQGPFSVRWKFRVNFIGLNHSSEIIPKKYKLYQNYPNPFNPVTHINFDIPKTSWVKLQVWDILGREVQILVDEELKPGKYDFSFDASALSSGIYYYKINSYEFSNIKKMILLK